MWTGSADSDEVAALDPAEDQQVVDQPVEPVRLERDVLHELRIARLEGGRAAEQPRPGDDRRHGRPELVRHDAEERLGQATRLALLLEQALPLGLRGALRGHVAVDRHEPCGAARLVRERPATPSIRSVAPSARWTRNSTVNGAAGRRRAADPLAHDAAVLLVDVLEVGVERPERLVVRDPVQPAELGGHLEPARLDVHLPGAGPRDTEGQAEAAVAVAEEVDEDRATERLGGVLGDRVEEADVVVVIRRGSGPADDEHRERRRAADGQRDDLAERRPSRAGRWHPGTRPSSRRRRRGSHGRSGRRSGRAGSRGAAGGARARGGRTG